MNFLFAATRNLNSNIKANRIKIVCQFCGSLLVFSFLLAFSKPAYAQWSLTGNAGTDPAPPTNNFLGTTDDQSLEIKVNQERALRLEPNAQSPNLIGGSSANEVTSDVEGATIGGGGVVTLPNRITNDYGTVSGGLNNQTSGIWATIGGGSSNQTSGSVSTVAGGNDNQAIDSQSSVGGGMSNRASGVAATISGGINNRTSGVAATIGGGLGNKAIGDNSTIAGGSNNQASLSESARETSTTVGGGSDNIAGTVAATVSGGQNNAAILEAEFGTIGGGKDNRVFSHSTTVGGGENNEIFSNSARSTIGGGGSNKALGLSTTIGGGEQNEVSSNYATIGGGANNKISGGSNGSFATVGGGFSNEANGNSSTVGGGILNKATGINSTVSGGFSNEANGNYSFAGGNQAKANHQGSFVWGDSTPADLTSFRDNDFVVRATGGVTFFSADPNRFLSGVRLQPNESSWESLGALPSMANLKPVNGRDVVANLAAIPIQTWNYKNQNSSSRHMGPLAQDLYKVFGLGTDNRYISTIDADGIALAAIQGLYQMFQEKNDLVIAQQQQIEALNVRLKKLESRDDKTTNKEILQFKE